MNTAFFQQDFVPRQFTPQQFQPVRLDSCLSRLRSCLNARSQFSSEAGYAEVLLELTESALTDDVRRWLRELGASHFVEASPGLLSCIVEDVPEMAEDLESHSGIARVIKVRSINLGAQGPDVRDAREECALQQLKSQYAP